MEVLSRMRDKGPYHGPLRWRWTMRWSARDGRVHQSNSSRGEVLWTYGLGAFYLPRFLT